MSSDTLATCGSVSFNVRQGDWYPKIPYIESVKHWTITYTKDMTTPGTTLGMPEFFNGPPTHKTCWTARVSLKDLPTVFQLAARRIEFLTKTMLPPRLDGVDTVVCWLSTKIMPLHHRPIKMCEYKAVDAGNSTLDQISLELRLRELVKCTLVKAAEGVAMFTLDNPVQEVKHEPSP